MSYARKLKFTWLTVATAVDALADMVRASNPDLIVGVSRGGLVPATILSHQLGIPLCTISMSTYEGTRRTVEKPITIAGWESRYDSYRTLIVDDILDTGDTFSAIRKLSTKANFATVVTKRPQEYNFAGVIYFAQVHKDTWVQFPWEQDETDKPIIPNP